MANFNRLKPDGFKSWNEPPKGRLLNALVNVQAAAAVTTGRSRPEFRHISTFDENAFGPALESQRKALQPILELAIKATRSRKPANRYLAQVTFGVLLESASGKDLLPAIAPHVNAALRDAARIEARAATDVKKYTIMKNYSEPQLSGKQVGSVLRVAFG